MTSFDLSLYLVTDRGLLTGRNLIDVVLEAVRGGVTMVQLREKTLPRDEIKALGSGLLSALFPLNIPLILNDNPDLSKEIGAQGVHLGQKDGDPSQARARLGPNAIIGLSVERFEDLARVPFEHINYIAASPVFQTRTKQDAASPLLLDGFKAIRRLCPLPLVAIGGIDVERARDIIRAGADGVAVASAILSSKDIYEASHEMKRAIETERDHGRTLL